VTQAGAGALGDLGIHMLDLIAYLFPAKWRVTHARLSKAWFERTVEAGSVLCNTDDVAEVLLTDYASGADARVVVSRATVGLRLMRVVSRGTNGTAIISIDPTDGSGSTEVLFSNPADRHRQSLRPENMNPYLYLMQFLKVPGSAPPAELATFEQGHLAQLLMEDALCFSRN
jgi:predicted dehydrogenase